jgi:3'-phosphoadenosine 5'-phosphosulfate sulfotransferase (PAPS reductase)/FAD synthetase
MNATLELDVQVEDDRCEITVDAEVLLFLFDCYVAFILEEAGRHQVSITREIAILIASGSPIAFGSSSGKDSSALVIKVNKFLDAVGHAGERIIVHAHLGDIEWKGVIEHGQKLARHVGLEFVQVRRAKGGMISRWYQREADNFTRYRTLSCVTVISPWSSAALRFCSSEQKIQPITSYLAKRWPGQAIINAIGIRREESPDRAARSIAQVNKRLIRADGTSGMDWNAIIELLAEEVFLINRRDGIGVHFAYDTNGRLSCCVCVLSNEKDLRGACSVDSNIPAILRVIALELHSGFSFQPSRWLADIFAQERPELFTDEMRQELASAKRVAASRKLIEKRIPKELLYEKGWPTFQPTMEQCEIIASVRREVAALYGIEILYTTAEEVYARYAELLAEKAAREAVKARRAAKRAASEGKPEVKEENVADTPEAVAPALLAASTKLPVQPSLF